MLCSQLFTIAEDTLSAWFLCQNLESCPAIDIGKLNLITTTKKDILKIIQHYNMLIWESINICKIEKKI